MKIKPLSLTSIRTVPVSERLVDSDDKDFGAPYKAGNSLEDFLCSLPNLGCAGDLFRLRDAIVSARRHDRAIILVCGSRVFDAGLGPMVCRLIEQRLVTGIALTGAAMEEDVEIALCGRTLTTRQPGCDDGRFCVTEETACLINDAINFGVEENWGIGKSVGKRLLDSGFGHLDHSVIATATRFGVPLSVHPAIGADAFALHPASHGESIGAAGILDFRLLTGMMAVASQGVVINVASSVVMPRILIQAINAARNLGKKVEQLTVAMVGQPTGAGGMGEIAKRLCKPDGKSFDLAGPEEILAPLLFASVLESLGDEIK